MQPSKACPCGSDKAFSVCCQLIINKTMKPRTCEQLMRARYSAHVLKDIDFIITTCHPDVRHEHDAEQISQWCDQVTWQGLAIIATKQGLKKGFVEFEARFTTFNDSNKTEKHHEYSEFRKVKNQWFFYGANDTE